MQLPKRKLFTMSCMLFLGSLTVAAHELINTSSGVDELALTSIERVRGAEHIAVGHVLKHDGAIVFGMNTFFHFEFNINNVNVQIFTLGCKGTAFF